MADDTKGKPKRRPFVFIIEDHESAARFIRDDLEALGVDSESVIGNSSQQFFEWLKYTLQTRQDLRCDGLVLDMLFSKTEPDGGLRLWKLLDEEGIAGWFGKVMVLTGTDSYKAIDFFKNRGDIVCEAKGSRQFRRQALAQFARRLGA